MTDPKKSVVRLATRDDEPQLMAMCRELHAENGLFKMDEDATIAMLNRAFDRQGGIIGVIDAENEIAAVIYMLLSTFWYSKEDHLEELFAYVRPKHRKPAGHAAALIAFAKECSDRIGIPLVIGVLSNKQMAAKVRMYRKELGMPAGAFFVYGSPTFHAEDTMTFDPWKPHIRGRDWKKHREPLMELPPATMTTMPMPLLQLT